MSLELVGPFRQVLPLSQLPLKGPIDDDELEPLAEAGVLMADGKIEALGRYRDMREQVWSRGGQCQELSGDWLALPGFVDCHTHLCFAGSRARDYALRINGKSYLEIAAAGGGIWETVQQTRRASFEELAELTRCRARRALLGGVTTLEIKSGYGLDLDSELKMLEVSSALNRTAEFEIVPTFLGAHVLPRDFSGSRTAYLEQLLTHVLPLVRARNLARRVDVYVDEGAFSIAEARDYLTRARQLGFELTLHADQFTCGGSALAVELGVQSADHLEVLGSSGVEQLAKSEVVAVALPGASLGLGHGFAPARALLDAGACLAIASDHNPGSAPMGDLLLQAAVLGAAQRLSNAETFAALTFRAAQALGLSDRGRLAPGQVADLIAFPGADFREILYHQGQLKPDMIWKRGVRVRA